LIQNTKSNTASDVLRHEITSRIKTRMVEPNAKMVYETSDLQSDETTKLLGHEAFGVIEETNPPLGYNGLEALMGDVQLKELFRIEMQAIKGLIDQGFNISIQVNSIKTPDSLQKAIAILKEIGIDITKVNVGMNTAWPGNYLFLGDYLSLGLSFITLDERNLAKAYIAADLYTNERVRDTYRWDTIKGDMVHPIRMIEEAMADYSAQNRSVALRRISFDATVAQRGNLKANEGGINLNTENMVWTIRGDGKGVDMNFDSALIEKLKREGVIGLSPVILNITPVSNVWPLLGLKTPGNEDMHLVGI
jgi:hypothetical protein